MAAGAPVLLSTNALLLNVLTEYTEYEYLYSQRSETNRENILNKLIRELNSSTPSPSYTPVPYSSYTVVRILAIWCLTSTMNARNCRIWLSVKMFSILTQLQVKKSFLVFNSRVLHYAIILLYDIASICHARKIPGKHYFFVGVWYHNM